MYFNEQYRSIRDNKVVERNILLEKEKERFKASVKRKRKFYRKDKDDCNCSGS